MAFEKIEAIKSVKPSISLASFVCNILFSLAAIGFQVAADKLEAPNFFVYAG